MILDREVEHPLGEKGGMHQVVSEPNFFFQTSGKGEETKELEGVLWV
jgi:hypothetical protein